MKAYPPINPKFVVDESGSRVGVFLDIKEFDSLIEELEDLYGAMRAERVVEKGSPTRPLEEVEKEILGKDS